MKTMKKLTTFTATILLGFGLASCDGDKKGADAGTDAKKPAAEDTGTPGDTDVAVADDQMETVSLKVTGMT